MLNRPGFHSTAAIVAEVPNSSYLKNDDYDYDCAQLVISDCSRSIAIEFCTAKRHARLPDYWENDLAKVDTLIDVLKDFRKGLVAEYNKECRRRDND